MAQDIRLDFSDTPAAVTITLNSVADAGNATSSGIDLGEQAPPRVSFEASLDGNSASNTGDINWYAMWSQDNTDFTDANNATWFHASQMNGTTAFKDVFDLDVAERYVKIYAVNSSGDSLGATGNALMIRDVAVDQA